MAAATKQEMMIAVASRVFRDGQTAFIGVGVTNLAANLARRTRTPGLVMIYESGIVGAKPFKMPLSVGDPGVTSNCECILGSMETFMWVLQGGRVDIGFLSGAQVDRWGNLNSTVIGDYHRPTVRLPGSGGASDIASLANTTIIVMPHQLRRFPERVDFITSPGFVNGREGRRAAGIPGEGPVMVITDLGVLGFDAGGEMELRSLHPGVRLSEVREQTGWPLKVAASLDETVPPSAEELEITRALVREQKS
jgi:glutaconate CoA-transferase subunit B